MSLRRATVWMAAGTGLSRLTGVIRVVATVAALEFTRLADAYNLANTAPNMLYDIVLGGVLSATFIPVFVDRLATRKEDEAWEAISAVVTLSFLILVGAAVVLWFAAPLVVTALTALDRTHSLVQHAALAREQAVTTTLLRWFVPQVAFYGFIALLTALLNTRRRFVAPMWVPIANNVVCIAVLLLFAAAVPHPSLLGVQTHRGQLVLLGLGTTLGVVLQFLLLLPALRGAGIVSRLRFRFAPGHEAVRRILHLGAWTFGFVLANQVALFVVLALAVGAPGAAPVSSYTYAYTFFQMPYAVITVSVMSAVTPDLAARWSTGALGPFRRRLATGLRAILAIIIPASVGLLLLAHPAVDLLPVHGGSTGSTGAALAMFALGLPGFCTFLYLVRVLQAMQRPKTAFWLYLLENGLNVALAVALVGPLGVRGLALSLSVAYTVAALAGLVVLRRWLGPLAPRRTWAPLGRVVVASLAMGLGVLVVANLSGATSGPALWVRVAASVVVGVGVFLAVVFLLAARTGSRPH
jgi:putative peptidoglycan lipid II flippase